MNHYLDYESKNIFHVLLSDTDPVHMQLFPSSNIPCPISQVTQAVNQSCAHHTPLNTPTHILAWSTRRKQGQCRVVLVALGSDSNARIVALMLFGGDIVLSVASGGKASDRHTITSATMVHRSYTNWCATNYCTVQAGI